MNNLTKETFLAHHGVQGMKWGVRNYQPYPSDYKGSGKFLGDKTSIKSKTKFQVTRGVPTSTPKRRPTGEDDPILGIDKSWVIQAQNNVYAKLGPKNTGQPWDYGQGTGLLWQDSIQELMDEYNLTQQELVEMMAEDGITEEDIQNERETEAKHNMLTAVYPLIQEYMKTPIYSWLNDGQRHTENEFLAGSARLVERIWLDLGHLFEENPIAMKVLKEDKTFKNAVAKEVGEQLRFEALKNYNRTTDLKNPVKGKSRKKNMSDSGPSEVKRRGEGLNRENLKKRYSNLPGYAVDAIYRSQDNSGKSTRGSNIKSGALQSSREKLKKQYPNLPDYAIDAMLKSKNSAEASKGKELSIEQLARLTTAKRKAKG